ncbi:MAG: sigma-70 family RNA polymerase sigma factor [Gammaproteobacteria bacterium]|nr:sigma-70 family RNA polymerase sigma factor [Gammaproteobacteria bacterium]
MTDQPTSSSALARLLTLSGQSDAAALESLYRVVSPQLYGLLMSMLNNADAASEALKRTFADVWEDSAGYRPDLGSPMSWLSHIARGHAVIMLRQFRESSGQHWSSADLSETAASAELNLDMLVDNQQLDDVLMTNGMGENVQQMVKGAYLQGASATELAQDFNLSTNQVKSQLRGWLMGMQGQVDG